MVSIPFGLSVHHFISSVGADAGFASLIGLALLVLLYFAHARETATLRGRADEAGLRVQELEAQVADLADYVAALPAEISVRAASPRAAAAYAPAQERAVAGVGASDGGLSTHPPRSLPPSAPAGVAAPALAAATRLIPLPDDLPPVEPVPATAAGATNGATRVPVGAGATVQRPVKAPAGAGVSGAQVPAGPGRAGGAPVRPGGAGRPGAGPPRPPGQARPGTRPGGPLGPMRPAPKRSRTGRILAGIAVAVVGAAAVVAAVLLLSRGGTKPPHKAPASSTLASRRAAAKTVLVQPSTVTVAVLNGTDQNGLAAQISGKLSADGFRKGAVTNAADQTHTTSTVQYVSAADKPDAVAVASSLKLSATSVQAIDPGTQQIACSAAPSPCTTKVVVTVGSDLASQ
jgi:LytR cell envelope-related transcriptional attenuator